MIVNKYSKGGESNYKIADATSAITDATTGTLAYIKYNQVSSLTVDILTNTGNAFRVNYDGYSQYINLNSDLGYVIAQFGNHAATENNIMPNQGWYENGDNKLWARLDNGVITIACNETYSSIDSWLSEPYTLTTGLTSIIEADGKTLQLYNGSEWQTKYIEYDAGDYISINNGKIACTLESTLCIYGVKLTINTGTGVYTIERKEYLFADYARYLAHDENNSNERKLFYAKVFDTDGNNYGASVIDFYRSSGQTGSNWEMYDFNFGFKFYDRYENKFYYGLWYFYSLTGDMTFVTKYEIGAGATYSAGSGISISGNVINCTEKSNYKIVEDLSAITSPTEGIKAYVKSSVSSETWQGYEITVPSSFDGRICHLGNNGGYDTQLNRYSSMFNITGVGDLTDDGNWHILDNWGYKLAYYADNTNYKIKIVWQDTTGKSLEELSGEATTASTSTSMSITIPSKQYIYQNQWLPTDKAIYYDFDIMTQSERATAYATITGSGLTNVFVYKTASDNSFGYVYYRFMGITSNECRFLSLCKGITSSASEGVYVRILKLSSDGSISYDNAELNKYNPYIGYIQIDSAGTVTEGNAYDVCRGLGSAPGGGYQLENYPIRYVISGQQYARGSIQWAIDNGDNSWNFGGFIKIGSTLYKGEWNANMSTDSFTTISFTTA